MTSESIIPRKPLLTSRATKANYEITRRDDTLTLADEALPIAVKNRSIGLIISLGTKVTAINQETTDDE